MAWDVEYTDEFENWWNDLTIDEQAIELELTISQLREALGATQESVAERMNVTQSNVSHFERNPNIFLRSLASYVEALGGRLEVRAVFPDQVVTLAVSGTQRQPSGPGTS